MKTTRRTSWTSIATSAALFVALSSMPAWAASITVPDGTFTTGAGSVGGLLLGLGASGTSTIGSGPWVGTYEANIGLLLAPSLTISNTGGEPSGGEAIISGIVGDNVLGIVDNGGAFSQSLAGTPYLANTTYTLRANVDEGTVLTVGALANQGIGIGMYSGSSPLGGTGTPSDLLSVTLLTGTDYSLAFQFTTGAVAPTGNIGIALYDVPSGVAAANLLGGVAFSNVTLDATTATPEPGTFAMLSSAIAALFYGRRKLRVQMVKERLGIE